MKKLTLLVIICSLHFCGFSQDESDRFYVLKTDYCMPKRLLDAAVGGGIEVKFVVVNGLNRDYNSLSYTTLDSLKIEYTNSVKNFTQKLLDDFVSSSKANILFVIYFSENPDGNFYCDGDNDGPAFPTKNSDNKGILLGKFRYQKNSDDFGSFDYYSNTFYPKIIDVSKIRKIYP